MKEKLCLDALGLKVGDTINLNYPKNMSSNFEIKECDDWYFLENETMILPEFIQKLIDCDFMLIKHKKTIGDLICGECDCDECPLCNSICNKTATDDKLYDGLEKAKEDEVLNDREYSLFKDLLDEEIE